MENKTRSLVLTILFFSVIIILTIGGYFYVHNLKNSKRIVKKEVEDKRIDYRLDKSKDYVYFENEKIISEEPDIVLKDAIINLEGAEIINSTLKAEMETIASQVTYITDQTPAPTQNQEKIYKDSNIYSAVEREYSTYKTNKYLSLLIKDLTFNCYEDFIISNIDSYVIDLKKSTIISNEDLLKEFNITMDDIKNRVSQRIDETQSVVDEKNVILKDDTINNLEENYALYVDGNKLYISYIVKSNFVDYNESIIIN